MKDEYIDHYGIDSLPQLRHASQLNAQSEEEVVFVTSCQPLLTDREELQNLFNIRILTLEEAAEENQWIHTKK